MAWTQSQPPSGDREDRSKARPTYALPTVLAALALLIVSSLTTSPADAAIYWVNGQQSIARANLDGSQVQLDLIEQPSGQILDVAVDAAHIYWASVWDEHYSISRASIDGANVEKNFIRIDADHPVGEGLAVDSGHVYWATIGTLDNAGAIARADIGGAHVDLNFIPGPDSIAGVAVDAGHLYWTNFFPGAVWRANLDGTNVEPNFITGDTGKYGVTVDASHVYWANYGTDSIGRANLDGTSVNDSFWPACRLRAMSPSTPPTSTTQPSSLRASSDAPVSTAAGWRITSSPTSRQPGWRSTT